MSSLELRQITVSVDQKQIVHGLDLTVKPGEIHAIMGPNGSGKSSLAKALAGHPEYQLGQGSQVRLNDRDLVELSPDERSQAGLFLAFQYPVEVPGVKVERFLRLAHQARFAEQPERQFAKAIEFRRYLEDLAQQLQVKPELLRRGLNEDFSGGEKKRLEVLQMAVLAPQYAILDETDSGLDIDAIKAVAHGVRHLIDRDHTGIIIITHYQRILDYLTPDRVHVMHQGRLVESGGPELVLRLEKTGYEGIQ